MYGFFFKFKEGDRHTFNWCTFELSLYLCTILVHIFDWSNTQKSFLTSSRDEEDVVSCVTWCVMCDTRPFI